MFCHFSHWNHNIDIWLISYGELFIFKKILQQFQKLNIFHLIGNVAISLPFTWDQNIGITLIVGKVSDKYTIMG